MGKAEFISKKIPVSGPSREALNERFNVDGKEAD
jgi:hypothetical protein